jgi:hypothetical protein
LILGFLFSKTAAKISQGCQHPLTPCNCNKYARGLFNNF